MSGYSTILGINPGQIAIPYLECDGSRYNETAAFSLRRRGLLQTTGTGAALGLGPRLCVLVSLSLVFLVHWPTPFLCASASVRLHGAPTLGPGRLAPAACFLPPADMSFRVVLLLKAFADHPPLPNEADTRQGLERPALHQMAVGQVRRHAPRAAMSHAALCARCLTSLHAGGAGCHKCKLARRPACAQVHRSEQLLRPLTALQALGLRQDVSITTLLASRLADPPPPPPSSPSAPLTQQGQPGQQQAPQQAEPQLDQGQEADKEAPDLPAAPQEPSQPARPPGPPDSPEPPEAPPEPLAP